MFRHSMAGNEKYSLLSAQKSDAKFYALTVFTVLFLVVFVIGYPQYIPSQNIQDKSPAPVPHSTGESADSVSKPLLSKDDQETYRRIFRAQKAADWTLANKEIAKLKNRMLLGDVLADRYLHRHYDASVSEIISWLRDYSDRAQTQNIIELAGRKYPAIFANLAKAEKPVRLQGYGDGNGDEIRFDGNTQAKKLWQHGLEAWRSGKKPEAAKIFTTLADKQPGLSEWQHSAASFWAYRSYLATGNKKQADYYLTQAAANSHVFYGILARKQLDKPLELDTKPVETSNIDIKNFMAKARIQRIVALAESGLNERAEAQVRAIFPSSSKQEKWALLSLANKLGLPSVQISMAKQLASNERSLDALKYPIPQWQPEGGFRVDPALIYALMRQESGFHPAAISAGGALGLMQLMPDTARKMQNTGVFTKEVIGNVSEPVLNITLGERYVEHLLGNELVSGNLFYMLAAYNAGIGRLKEWQYNINYNDDPLLFVETIPYPETRNYITKVMTNYWIYCELIGTPSKSVYSLLHNNWPHYASIND